MSAGRNLAEEQDSHWLRSLIVPLLSGLLRACLVARPVLGDHREQLQSDSGVVAYLDHLRSYSSESGFYVFCHFRKA